MIDATRERILGQYSGEAGRRWRRIETGSPESWSERNAVVGRERMLEKLHDWVGSADGLRVLDAGCGVGTIAGILASNGATVQGVDLCPSFIDMARESQQSPRLDFQHADLHDVARGLDGDRDLVLLIEVLDDYEPSERLELLRAVTEAKIPRIISSFLPAPSAGDRVWDLVGPQRPTPVDPIELLRWIHTSTPYRQARLELLKVRGFRVQLSELVLS